MRPRILIAVAVALVLVAATRWHSRREGPERSAALATPSLPDQDESDRRARPVVTPGAASDDSLSAPKASAVVSNHWLQALLAENGEIPALPPEAIARWLALNGTNAAALLAARQAGGGRTHLYEALTNFPNDPRVLFAASGLEDGSITRRELLDRFKSVAPENALPDYLSARDHFKAGRTEEALADLASASAKSRFDDYTLDAIQNTEDLYLQAGKSPAEAKALAATSTLLPHLAQFKGLAQEMGALQRERLAAGDLAGAEQLAQAGFQLSEHLGTGEGSRLPDQSTGRHCH